MEIKRRRYAFDLDDTIYAYASNMLDFFNRHTGNRLTMADFTDYHIYNVMGITPEESDEWISRFVNSSESIDLPPIEGAREVLVSLKDRGHELFIVTARWTSNRHEFTNAWLERFLPGIFPAKNIIFTAECGGNYTQKPKSKFCRELGIDIFIDDRLLYVLQCAAAGVASILFQPDEYRWNLPLPEELPGNVRVARDWPEVDQYIDELSNLAAA